MFEFHIAQSARQRYQFKQSLFSWNGNVVFADMSACREFAHRINQVRDAEHHPERAVHAGAIYAMGLIDEAAHILLARYRQQFDPELITAALSFFAPRVGEAELDKMLLTFVEHFPGQSVIQGQQTPQQWLAGSTGGVPHRAAALEELILLWTANRNEAFKPFDELFPEAPLAEKTVYRQITQEFTGYFSTRPLVPVPDAKPISILDLLRAPALNSPRSLADQLALIRRLWSPILGDTMERFLLIAGEVLREEELAVWMQFNPPAVQARQAAAAAAERRREEGTQMWPSIVSHSEVPVFGDPAHEYEKFSPDTNWMPNTVLIAKSTYVWLAQLSRQYGRPIHRLDEIPGEELATLARRGLNSLWLIGIWERSRASKTIKQLCGNTDAVASAYSLYDYKISEDLGGERAYNTLRDRAYAHGIRLASDMVPNHMGIDSPWVIEHPEWFISRADSPYPAYKFEGPDLSGDSRVEIKIDDHYYEQTDAAVVFRRRDTATGDVRYVYHGNDGTSFPWNDTAQLDYLNPVVREQVIQTILQVARLFPVIRFDAAMTLAKRHFHRLWFPGEGSSGAIPSRAEYSMSDAEFNKHMPFEFWREVVDRVAAEVPDTLLLAEAFWLMEGYFVRTLGMHRVYNSAFMNMMRDEENAKYRSVIKNTLEFDPDVLKRYVNFMSNPDERTAIDQFGTGDKCFGVAVMMATLPGLPMFGHGQIEGFTEKYGMEYQRPRYEENADPHLVARHDREVAPLLKRRWLFAESSNFLLYDLFQANGKVDENVFAYSNRTGNAAALVVYNNRFSTAKGSIDFSAAYADKATGQLRQRRLREGLGLSADPGPAAILTWRDSLTGLEYLRRASELNHQGLPLELHAYQSHVFLDWRELQATDKPWDKLCDDLNGKGVPNLNDALVNLELRPVHEALRNQLDSNFVRLFADLAEHPRGPIASGPAAPVDRTQEKQRTQFFDLAWVRSQAFLRLAQKSWTARAEDGARSAVHLLTDLDRLSIDFRSRLRAAMRFPALEASSSAPWSGAARHVLPSPSPRRTATAMWGPVLAWCVLALLAESIDPENPESTALDLFDRLRLREPLAKAFAELGFEGEESWRAAARIKVLLLASDANARQKHGPAPPKPAQPAHKSGEVAAVFAPVTPHSLHKAVKPAAEPCPEPVALPAALWIDPDVRWLTGVNESEGHTYFNQEQYEELLWWMLLPALLSLASEAHPGRHCVDALNRDVHAALNAANAAGFRVDLLVNPPAVKAPAAPAPTTSHATTPEPPAPVSPHPSAPPAEPTKPTVTAEKLEAASEPAKEQIEEEDATSEG
jgi:glycosidase